MSQLTNAHLSAVSFSSQEPPVIDLSYLFPGADSPELAAAFADFETRAERIDRDYRGRMASLTAEEMLEFLHHYEDALKVEKRITTYADESAALNMSDANKKLKLDAQTRIADITKKYLLFITIELEKIPDADLQEKIASSPELARYESYFRDIKKYEPHTLDEARERLLLALEAPAHGRWISLFDSIEQNMKFELGGKKLSMAEVLDEMQEQDRDRRAAAYEAFTAGLKTKLPEIASVHNAIADYMKQRDEAKGYRHPWSSRNMANDTTDAAMKALASTVTNNFHRISHAARVPRR